jgi:hypothetical protein
MRGDSLRHAVIYRWYAPVSHRTTKSSCARRIRRLELNRLILDERPFSAIPRPPTADAQRQPRIASLASRFDLRIRSVRTDRPRGSRRV